MFECKNVAGRTVRSIHLFGGGPESPEVSVDFEDGANLNISLVSKHTLECKLTQNEGGSPSYSINTKFLSKVSRPALACIDNPQAACDRSPVLPE
jgi:hypothetical protein